MAHLATEPVAPTVDSPKKLVMIVLGLTTILTVMLLAFAAPALHSGPEDLPLAVSGPEQGVSQVTAALEKESPGTFDVTTHDSAGEAADAIRDREAIGGIAVGPDGITVQTAAGSGSAYAQLLQGVGSGLERSGQEVTYDELAATTDDDPSAAGISTIGLPLVFGGMATAALLLLAYTGPASRRFTGAGAVALLGGLLAAAVLQLGFGAFDGTYWQIAASIAVGILAISSVVLGLGALLGRAGIGIGALTMLLVANPLSGLANGPEWLPQPWGDIGQLLPVGATGSLVRSVAYFDGGGATAPVLVLLGWVVTGMLLAALGVARQRRRVAA